MHSICKDSVKLYEHPSLYSSKLFMPHSHILSFGLWSLLLHCLSTRRKKSLCPIYWPNSLHIQKHVEAGALCCSMFILMFPVAGQPSSSTGSLLLLLRVWLSSNFLPLQVDFHKLALRREPPAQISTGTILTTRARCQEAPIEVEVPMWFSCSFLFVGFFWCFSQSF